MRLVIASNNVKKRKEIASILGALGIEIVAPEDTTLVDVEENADSFADNAKLNADAFAEANQCAALADDSGLCVDALNGAPGVYSSRYAGANASDADNNKKLLRDLQGKENRHAHFACALHLSLPDGRALTAEGRVEGVIRRSPEGHGGFGYDPLFFCPELGKVFAETSAEEKASVSHRGRALRMLAGKLASLD
ncbi:MAG: non-canonical purine NTP pyrophosphatase, RdgB/HAM1 family [Zetaproteobacteria bacterium CG_4_8_14_3_um_filter_59_5]|nr:MAG: non-canonical purine NTP pyrophosphatase, RdgB/HAM1 family [Zetaproteobacteria bacterium CG_4_8_14_3_um_filter_59_5]